MYNSLYWNILLSIKQSLKVPFKAWQCCHRFHTLRALRYFYIAFLAIVLTLKIPTRTGHYIIALLLYFTAIRVRPLALSRPAPPPLIYLIYDWRENTICTHTHTYSVDMHLSLHFKRNNVNILHHKIYPT